jgi:hypothetical protein
MPRGKYRIPKDEQILEAIEKVFGKSESAASSTPKED